MASVIVPAAIDHVVNMGIVDEVADFFAALLIIFSFVFIVDFGLDIEEGVALVSATLATVILKVTSVSKLPEYGARHNYR